VLLTNGTTYSVTDYTDYTDDGGAGEGVGETACQRVGDREKQIGGSTVRGNR
jgi:hypothetical protein